MASFISTRLTKLLDTRTPIVLAPMGTDGGSGNLASEVSLSGGFGFLAPRYVGSENFMDELAVVRTRLKPNSSGYLPIGVGFIGWILDLPSSPYPGLLRCALETRVQAVWLAFGVDLGRWIQFVRDHDRTKKSPAESKTLIFVIVNSVSEALIATYEWNVDVLVAQGIEAGGHGHGKAPPLLSLVPSILAAIPTDKRPIIIAAGGLMTGSHLASLLTLGADGAAFGTRFLFTPESLFSLAQKNALIEATHDSTVRSVAFDHALGTLGWPDDVNGRALRTNDVDDFERGVENQEIRMRGYDSRNIVWAGTGVGLVNEITPAKDVVQELHQSAVEHLRAASTLVVT